MKTINLIIEPHEYKALDKACGYLNCEILQYKDAIHTIYDTVLDAVPSRRRLDLLVIDHLFLIVTSHC